MVDLNFRPRDFESETLTLFATDGRLHRSLDDFPSRSLQSRVSARGTDDFFGNAADSRVQTNFQTGCAKTFHIQPINAAQ